MLYIPINKIYCVSAIQHTNKKYWGTAVSMGYVSIMLNSKNSHPLDLIWFNIRLQYISYLYGQWEIPFWSNWSEGLQPMYKLMASPSSLNFLECPSTRSPIGATATHNAMDIASVSFLILLVAQSARVPPAEWPRTTTLHLSAVIVPPLITSSSLYKACKMSSLVPGQPPPTWPTLRYSMRQTSYPRLNIRIVSDPFYQITYLKRELSNPLVKSPQQEGR